MSTAPLIRTLQDIEQIESTPLSERDLPSSTFELKMRPFVRHRLCSILAG